MVLISIKEQWEMNFSRKLWALELQLVLSVDCCANLSMSEIGQTGSGLTCLFAVTQAY